METLLIGSGPQQPCFGEACPNLPQHVADDGGDPESAADCARIIDSCNSMTGPSGKPGEAGFQCGILLRAALYAEEPLDETREGGEQ